MTIESVSDDELITSAWGNSVATDLNALNMFLPTSSAVDVSEVTAESGWSVENFIVWRFGEFLQFRLRIERTGATISVGGDGNIANTLVATLANSWRGAVEEHINIIGAGVWGRMAGGTLAPSTGEVTITAMSNGEDILNGDEITFGGMFYIGAAT